MSERGTFVTSFLYDEGLVPVLRAALVKVARKGSFTQCFQPSEQSTMTAFAGVMHGSYPGEESLADMPNLIEEDILPNLQPDHGQFSIVVMPECEEYTRLFVFHKGEVTMTWLNNDVGRRADAWDKEMAKPAPPPLNISDIARAEKGLTPKPE